MSGLSHTPGKRARGYTLRGFESRLLRQKLRIILFPNKNSNNKLFTLRGDYGHDCQRY